MEDFSIEALAPPQRGLRLIGELDIRSADELNGALSSLHGDGDVTLDLSGLTFIDSAGLHAILQHAALLDGSNLVLVDASEMTRRIFEIVALEKHPSIVMERSSSGE